MSIRDARREDFPAILDLNQGSVEVLSPLDGARLDRLHGMAAYHRLVEHDGVVVALLLALREGADYDSPNYAWFSARHPRFLYVDRIVVAPAARGGGIAALLYADVVAFAADHGGMPLTCEVDLDPPNPASMRFHARRGFREVGTQRLPGSGKQVSLLVRAAD